MLRDVRVQKMLEFSDSLEQSSRECKIGYRLRTVVNLLSDPDMNAHRFFQVCLAALAYQMSGCASFSEMVDDEMVKLMIKQLRQGRKEGVRELVADRNVPTQCVQSCGYAKKKRSFLKRKTSSYDGRNEAVIYQGLDKIFGSEEFLSFSKASNTSFENIALSTLFNLLDHECYKQTNEPSIHSCAEPSMNTKYNQQHIVLAALRTTQSRRRILVQCDGIATLTKLLEARYHSLKNACFGEQQNLNDPESISYLHDVRVVLRVLYQASFLCVSVQRSMVQEEGMLAVLLELVQYLGEACFAPEAMPKKESNTPIDLALDVLLATLRVILNLTHNNDAAAIQIGRLQGIQILFHAFCRLWHLVAHGDNIEMDEKVIYDGFLLLLSAMTNTTEYNARNRDIVTGIPNTFSGLQLLGASNVCNVVVSFFMNKISSYVEYIDATDGQEDSASDRIEESSRLFVPEDVILGGCASLFLGCLMKDRPENASMILRCLPNQSSKLPLRALSAFVALHSQIGTLTAEVGKSVLEVEKVFKLYSDLGEVPTQQNLTPNKLNDCNDEKPCPTPESSQDAARLTTQHAWLTSKSQTQLEPKSSVLELHCESDWSRNVSNQEADLQYQQRIAVNSENTSEIPKKINEFFQKSSKTREFWYDVAKLGSNQL
uniref:Uncharacterized protein AlNc14C16G1738 n=1 Tax=Albugo laibachii Nc14 TaxID=890382 RepID=F0W455_9STRA|nr:conserved hypothetical protein [Albugo laibachii Nc14]|eukprot:CCA15853.1 conserved hypothetical protein [Albugo laibachii Nc14]